MIIFRDHLFNVVCNIRTPKADGKISIGTGSFIIKDNKVYLLTADHVAKTVDNNTVLAFGKHQSNCVVLPLTTLSNGNVWKIHPIADMAVIELNILGHLNLFQDRKHPSPDGTDIGKADSKRMLEAYIHYCLHKRSKEREIKFAKSSI